MRRTPYTAAITAGLLLATPALAQTVPPAMISVTGEATISVPPDMAEIDGGFTSEAKTAREASNANNAAMGKLLLALKAGAASSAPAPIAAASHAVCRVRFIVGFISTAQTR